MTRAAIIAVLMLVSGAVFAMEPGEKLADPAQEAKAEALFSELRCMVCQNQSILDSEAPLAKDLRMLVRERVTAGDSPEAIKDFLVARYGDFVLLKPRLSAQTALLWAVPVIAIVVGCTAAILGLRRRKAATEQPLTDEERSRLAALTKGETT